MNKLYIVLCLTAIILGGFILAATAKSMPEPLIGVIVVAMNVICYVCESPLPKPLDPPKGTP